MSTTKSRTYYSIVNVAASFSLEVLHLLFSFGERTVFIHVLGEEILGLSGLFSSFLRFLSLADLGLSSAFTYTLYKPLAQNDYDRVAVLINFYKKFYRVLFVAVFGVGLLISPLVIGSIKDISISNGQAFSYYLLILLNSACSYLAVYKSTLFRADQHAYVVNLANVSANVLCSGVQVVLLLTTGNYYFYLIIRIVLTLLNNLFLTIFANHSYKGIVQIKTKGPLDKETKNYFISSLKSLFVYKVSTVAINNSSNIIISLVLGTVVVGVYSNYTMLTVAVTTFTGLFDTSILGSIGNLGATSTPKRKKEVFFKLISIYSLISVFCSVCLYMNLSDFILVWLGKPEYVLDDFSVFCYILYFFFNTMCSPLWMTREANGLFSKVWGIMVARAVVSISMSILLSMVLGLPGIFLGSLIGLVTTNMWYEPKMLCNDVFYCRFREFAKVFLFSFIKASIVFVTSIVLFRNLGTTIFWMVVKCMLVGVLCLVVYSKDILSVLRRAY